MQICPVNILIHTGFLLRFLLLDSVYVGMVGSAVTWKYKLPDMPKFM